MMELEVISHGALRLAKLLHEASLGLPWLLSAHQGVGSCFLVPSSFRIRPTRSSSKRQHPSDSHTTASQTWSAQ